MLSKQHLKKSALLLLAAANIAATEPVNDSAMKIKWSYVGSTGPTHWGMLSPEFELCDTGKAQSPIDIGRKKTRIPYALQLDYRPAQLVIGEDIPTEIRINQKKALIDTGHALQVNFNDNKVQESVLFNGEKYRLVQFHFHSPSETLWHKMSFPLEIHMVHERADGNLLVLAVFVKGGEENKALNVLLDHLPAKEGQVETIKDAKVNPTDYLPKDKRYYTYNGSLTSPPCVEGVQWVVMPDPITASPAQILKIRNVTHGSNARATQPLNGREIFYAVP